MEGLGEKGTLPSSLSTGTWQKKSFWHQRLLGKDTGLLTQQPSLSVRASFLCSYEAWLPDQACVLRVGPIPPQPPCKLSLQLLLCRGRGGRLGDSKQLPASFLFVMCGLLDISFLTLNMH